MRGIIFGIFASAWFCSAQGTALAADVTWFCSALTSKTDKKPTAFKFEIRGGELVDLHVWPDAFFKKWELQQTDVPPTKYKILKDTDKDLVAVHSYQFDKESGTSAIVILIDKVSNEFRQTAISTKTSEPSLNFEGSCLLSTSR